MNYRREYWTWFLNRNSFDFLIPRWKILSEVQFCWGVQLLIRLFWLKQCEQNCGVNFALNRLNVTQKVFFPWFWQSHFFNHEKIVIISLFFYIMKIKHKTHWNESQIVGQSKLNYGQNRWYQLFANKYDNFSKFVSKWSIS